VSASEPGKSDYNVRELATEILVKVETRKAYADILLDRAVKSSTLSRRDAALLTELTYGTLRWRGKIDALLKPLTRRPLQSASPFIRNLLRTTLYQILFLDRIPDYASVNAAVELAKIEDGERSAGFVNAVLRHYLRQKENREPSKPNPETATLSEMSEYWSHPEWLIKQWRDYLDMSEVTALLQANNEEAPLVLRVNTLRTSRPDFLELLGREGIAATPTRWSPQGITIRSGSAVDQLPGFHEGLFQVQGEASQLVSYLIAPQPKERILDACAAPGGKTSHLAELSQDNADITATDISQPGLKKVQENAKRLGLNSIRTGIADASKAPPAGSRLYDRILVDAPCSGLGTLRSHPEIKWNRSEANIKQLSGLQQETLRQSAARLKSGGVLVYSTCTLSLTENEEVVEKFLRNCDKFILEDAANHLPEPATNLVHQGYFMAWPHRHGTDGFFAARLRKVDA
jgi:16S rRNA (cytosine967-C5)-methyltransferase